MRSLIIHPYAVGSYGNLKVGDRFTSPPVMLAADRAEEMIRWAGYVHPLFTDRASRRPLAFTVAWYR
jgi:hypothetical protein